MWHSAGFTAEPGKSTNDWPQWRGPNRDGISSETGILKDWPEGGPKVLWKAPSGDGYSAIVIADGRLWTMYGQGSDEFLVCLDANSGKEIWRFRTDAKFRNSWGNGPRSTPTVDGSLVYALSSQSKLYALNASNGKEVWSHDLVKEYGAQVPNWGTATSPLVDGNLLLVDVGGDEFGLVAFNKDNGKMVWKTATDLPGYAAPIAITVNGVRQIIFFTGTAVISVSPDNGRKFWSHGWRTDYDVNAATPIFIPPDKLFISSGYNVGAAVLQINTANGTAKVDEVWKSRVMRNKFSSSIFLNGHVYGFDEGTFKCVDINTQETKWAERGLGHGSLIYADEHFIVLSESGKLLLVAATPGQYIEKERLEVLDGRTWTVPTLSDGKLYLKNQDEILCLNFSTLPN